MPLTLIEGTFRIEGAAPDGDSIKFYPTNKSDWNVLAGQRVRFNKKGGAQLRLDGIDTLETHYAPLGGTLGTIHQPLEFGHVAADALLKFLGFKSWKRSKDEKITDSDPDEIKGHILTRFVDTYGRAVAFALPGHVAGKKTGDQIRFDIAYLKRTANYHLLDAGLAYPTFYSKMYFDIRREMAKASQAARAAKKGVWGTDVTLSGATVTQLADVTEKQLLIPKIFRRLTDYFGQNDGNITLDGFDDYLAQRDDRVFVLSQGQITGFDSVVKVDEAANTVRLQTEPEDIIFQEK